MPSNQRQIIEQAKFAYSALGKAFEEQGKKQVKALEVLDLAENQKIKSIEGLFSREMKNSEFKNEKDEIKNWENKIKRNNLKYETNKYIFGFQQLETIKPFGDSIYTDKINIDGAEIDQNNLLENFVNFNKKCKPRSKEDRVKKMKKWNSFDSVNARYEGQELILNAFRSGIFPKIETRGKGLKILTPKQRLRRLPVALAQVKAGNTSLYQEITEKVYNNIINSIKL